MEPLDLRALALELRQGVVVKDRKLGLFSRTYEICFKGSDAVAWLKCNRTEEAVALGSLLLSEGLVVSLTSQTSTSASLEFKNEKGALYRFQDDEHRGRAGAAGAGAGISAGARAGVGTGAGTGVGACVGLLPELPWESKALRSSVADLSLPPLAPLPPPAASTQEEAQTQAQTHVQVQAQTQAQQQEVQETAELGVPPLDCHNRRLLRNVHPSGWVDPVAGGVYNLLVLGCGAGGLVSSLGARSMGAKVAVVEMRLMGGDCTNFGCVPSKALLKCASVAQQARTAHRYGVKVGGVEVDFAAVMRRMRRIRADISAFDAASRLSALGVDVYMGRGVFDSHNSMIVNGTRLVFRKCIICSGGRAFVPDIPGLLSAAPPSPPTHTSTHAPTHAPAPVAGSEAEASVSAPAPEGQGQQQQQQGQQRQQEQGWGHTQGGGAPFLTNESVFNLTQLPRRLLVLGGGPIGVELAQAFQRLGSEVTVLCRGRGVLDKEDEEAALLVSQALQREGVKVLPLCRVRLVEGVGTQGGVRVSLTYTPTHTQPPASPAQPQPLSPSLSVSESQSQSLSVSQSVSLSESQSESLVLEADCLLVAAGRRPTVRGMGLVSAGVAHSDADGITVDDYMRTSNPLIYAAGDCCSRFQFTHAADSMARICIRNALFHGSARFSQLVIPWCTFTSPEVAHVGLYPRDLVKRGVIFKTVRVEMRDVDRCRCDGGVEGDDVGEGVGDGVCEGGVGEGGVGDGGVEGFVSLHIGGDRILGCTIVGEGAADMVCEVAALMQAGQGMAALGNVVHPYPVRADALRHAADVHMQQTLQASPLTRGVMQAMLSWSLT